MQLQLLFAAVLDGSRLQSLLTITTSKRNGFGRIFNCRWRDSVNPLQFVLSIYAPVFF